MSATSPNSVTLDRLLDQQGRPFPEHIREVLVEVLLRVIAHPDADVDAVVDRAQVIGNRALDGEIADLPRYLTKALFAVSKEKRRRSRQRDEVLCSPQQLESVVPQTSRDSGSSIEARVLLEEVLSKLSPLDRRVYTLRADGWEHSEIAHELGISEPMSWLRFRRAKSSMASWLKVKK